MIPGNVKLEDCIQKLTLEQAVAVVAASRLAEEMRAYAASHDTPATGRTPSCYISSKTKDGFYFVADCAGSLVYCCIPIMYFFNKKYTMARNFELGVIYDECVEELGYEGALNMMTEYRNDFDTSSSGLMGTIDQAYEEMEEYFLNLTDSFTVDQLQHKKIGYVVS